jgi:hypothetical protein
VSACDRERLVRRAARENRWTDELLEHARTCSDCNAAAAAAPFMSRFAGINEREHILPDPSVVWLKAQLLGASVAADRASRPLNLIQVVAYVAVATGWAAVLTWKWADLEAWLLGFTPTRMVQGLSGASTFSLSFLMTVVILASVTVMLGLHTILAED